MTQAQLARRVAIEQPTMVRTIDRMERDGLVARTLDPHDRRASRITLTERGRALRNDLVPLAAGVNATATASLSDDEVENPQAAARQARGRRGRYADGMTKIGYACMLEQFHPTDLLDWAKRAEAAGFDAGFRSASTSTRGRRSRANRPSRGASWAPSASDQLPLRNRRHLPGVPLPPCGHRPRRRDAGRDVPRPLLARPWRRRGAQRARHRRRVAGGGHPFRDDVRGHRGHQQAVQRQGRQARRRILHARVRHACTPAPSNRSRCTSRAPGR